mmetsp:Transcript_10882/g.13094  ORF Transcript_10882/g.13094 Transcript_10882/m.13094 type:complete len:87 (-) Transcript_10882:62-322(-)
MPEVTRALTPVTASPSPRPVSPQPSVSSVGSIQDQIESFNNFQMPLCPSPTPSGLNMNSIAGLLQLNALTQSSQPNNQLLANMIYC